jgi:hypothetical protein
MLRFFVTTLQDDYKRESQQCGEQKLRDFEARYLRSFSEHVRVLKSE